MYLSNYLNRNITDQFAPLFEIIYCIELSFIALTIAAGGLLIYVMCSTTIFHRIIRLRVIFGVSNAMVYVLSRAVVMCHQYFGPRAPVVTWYLIFCNIQKEVFLSYMVILISVLAVDRWIATQYWAWSVRLLYEHNNKGPIAFFIAQEVTVHIIAYIEGLLLTYEFVSKVFTLSYMAAVTLAGSIGYAAIYRYNLRELEKMRVRANMNTYCVSRIYQIKENIALLRLFNKIALPLVLSTIPVFVFFLLYRFTPPSFDLFRHISIAMVDLWLSIACVAIISCIPLYERKIVRFLLGQSEKEKSPSSQLYELQIATDAHFVMLSKEWI